METNKQTGGNKKVLLSHLKLYRSDREHKSSCSLFCLFFHFYWQERLRSSKYHNLLSKEDSYLHSWKHTDRLKIKKTLKSILCSTSVRGARVFRWSFLCLSVKQCGSRWWRWTEAKQPVVTEWWEEEEEGEKGRERWKSAGGEMSDPVIQPADIPEDRKHGVDPSSAPSFLLLIPLLLLLLFLLSSW